MFHGYLKTLLDKQPSGEFARTHLYYFVTDYLAGKHVWLSDKFLHFNLFTLEGRNFLVLSLSFFFWILQGLFDFIVSQKPIH